tara:strand:+ start:178 stop:480 length:303 start_codon:yes stop_codon:yes gene_type:complete
MSKEKMKCIVDDKGVINIPREYGLFLCTWNSREVVEIHTKETLKSQYGDTNLFDEDNITWEVNGKERTFTELLAYLSLFDWSGFDDEVYINDNMTIRRIY